jgi:acyl-CoA thioesterase I
MEALRLRTTRLTVMVILSSRRARVLTAMAVAAMVAACSFGPGSAPAGESQPQAHTVPAADVVRVVALGDSLTAGLGLDVTEAYPSLLEARLRDAGLRAEVVNAGVSGDTSAGGLRRVDWSLDGRVHVLIVALGANDALRGLPVAEMTRNLGGIIARAQARHVAVVLAGMEAPPNLGPAYAAAFRRAYRDLAAEYTVPLLPFLLEGVAGIPSLNQADGIHPNAAGARKVADNLWPLVEPAVRRSVTHD